MQKCSANVVNILENTQHLLFMTNKRTNSIKIIPAIDIIGGKCVRLTQGNYDQKKVYGESPVEVAKQFEGAGMSRLHVVDLDGAKQKKIINHKVLEKIASQTSLFIDFGGGLRSNEDLKIAFESGACQVTGGSIAVKEPSTFEKWIHHFGPDKIILGSDVKDKKVAINGWEEATHLDLIPFLKEYVKKGIQYTICTDVSKDGLLQGTATDLYQEIKTTLPNLRLIASGGVSSMEDIHALRNIGIYGVIVGKAIYEGRITLSELGGFH